MKHIFTIHSHITFLAAIGTIVFKKIDTESVILICSGKYNPQLSDSFKGQILESFDDIEGSYSWMQKIKHFNYSKNVNSFITKIIKENNFIAYIDLMSVFNRYLVMHPQCKEFHIIEEGIVNYGDYDDFNLWTADLRMFKWQWSGLKQIKEMVNAIVRLLRGRSIRLLALPIHPNLYTLHRGVNAYCFSEYAFQYTRQEQKKILDWSTLTSFVDIDTSDYSNGTWFWIGDTLTKAYNINLNDFKKAIYLLMEEVNPMKQHRIVFLKFRGPESQLEKDITIKALIEYNFKIEILERNAIMEFIFLNGKDFNVCGIASSLLIYANLMGHTTYSMYKNIPEHYNISLTISYPTISKKVGYSL